MNKYEKSWNAICDGVDVNLDLDNMNELVDLHTPKKIEANRNNTQNCPNCGGFIFQTYNYNFCGNCGQALDWE